MDDAAVVVPLTKGYVAVIDAADADLVLKHRWCALVCRSGVVYAMRGTRDRKAGTQTTIMLHREILGLPPGRVPQVDHVDRDGLNNRRANLRTCTAAQNVANQGIRKTSDSGIKGVRQTLYGRWIARICVDGNRRHLGTFETAEDAELAYRRAAQSAFGEFVSP